MDINELEKPLTEIYQKINELKSSVLLPSLSAAKKKDIKQEIKQLEQSFDETAKQVYSNLTEYQITQLSRHPNRPNTNEIISRISEDFIELHGDRNFMDDASIVAGIGLFKGRRVAFVGHQKGRNIKENMKRNFGMPRPEGYRKALRIMSLAERFGLPIITFIDTPGAYPGMDAEERGQCEAIAKNIMIMGRLTVPIICIVIGEGGSGGALAISVGNRILMLEYSTYSVISPEGCASILWKDGSKADKAAQLLGLTSKTALKNKIIDDIIKEQPGAAHWHPKETIDAISESIEKHLNELAQLSKEELKADRIKKFYNIGFYKEIKDSQTSHYNDTPMIENWEESWDDVVNSFGI